MPDSERPPERGIERDLRDLGARIEYPPTPDLARSVRHQLDEQEGRRSPRRGFWPSLLSPRWAVPAAALVLISLALLSPAIRAPLSELLTSGQAASSGAGAGGSAVRPESGGSADRSEQQAQAGSEASRASVESGSRNKDRPASGGGGSVAPESAMAESADGTAAQAGSAACPSLSLGAEPERAAPGATFRLRGEGFAAGCGEAAGGARRAEPATDVRIDFRQDGKTWKLATVDADRRLTVAARLRVPAGAGPGQATVRATTRSGELVEEKFLILR